MKRDKLGFITFTIKLSKRHQVNVVIAPNKRMKYRFNEQMRRIRHYDGAKKHENRWVARTFLHAGRCKIFATMLFDRQRIGAGTIAHECAHVALYWCFESRGAVHGMTIRKEEFFCDTIDKLVMQFAINFWKATEKGWLKE